MHSKIDRAAFLYGALRWKPTFGFDVHKFIESAKKHAMFEKSNQIRYPCSERKLVLKDTIDRVAWEYMVALG